MGFITIEEVRKKFKGKSSNFIKGYFEGYNNPNQSEKNIRAFIENGGKMSVLSENAKDYFIGRTEGYKDKRK